MEPYTEDYFKYKKGNELNIPNLMNGLKNADNNSTSYPVIIAPAATETNVHIYEIYSNDRGSNTKTSNN